MGQASADSPTMERGGVLELASIFNGMPAQNSVVALRKTTLLSISLTALTLLGIRSKVFESVSQLFQLGSQFQRSKGLDNSAFKRVGPGLPLSLYDGADAFEGSR